MHKIYKEVIMEIKHVKIFILPIEDKGQRIYCRHPKIKNTSNFIQHQKKSGEKPKVAGFVVTGGWMESTGSFCTDLKFTRRMTMFEGLPYGSTIEIIDLRSTIQVTIPTHSQHGGYPGYLRTYEISDKCPTCDGPRGRVVPGISYDGSRRLHCDTWENPCGHTDKYSYIWEVGTIVDFKDPENHG